MQVIHSKHSQYTRRGARPWKAALLGLALFSGCSNGNSNKQSPSSNGGSSASGGSGGSAGTGGSGGQTTAAGFDGIWKEQSATFQVVDSASPLSFQQHTVSIPPAVPAPEDGRDAEFYQQFQGDTLLIYVHYAGDSVYYRVTLPVMRAGDGYFATLGDSQHVYLLENAQIQDSTTTFLGTVSFTAQIRFAKYQGTFPPGSWPQQAVDLDAAALAGAK